MWVLKTSFNEVSGCLDNSKWFMQSKQLFFEWLSKKVIRKPSVEAR